MTTGIAVELRWPIAPGIPYALVLVLVLALAALQTTDKWNVATPADWQPGEDVIVPPAGSCGTAEERVQGKEAGVKCLEWFLCFKEIPKHQLDLPPIWSESKS
jgi:hypothetical protein